VVSAVAEVVRAGQQPAAQPQAVTIPVNVTMPPQRITVQNNVEPTPITVEGATINVDPTPITVENNVEGVTVNVDPTPITVHNDVQPARVDVSLPARKIETTVQRDGAGNITGSTQIETDLEGEQ
jgi:hypothetical protein